MLISALCEYYDTLAAQGKVIPSGFSSISVSYMISLKENGEIDNIIDIRDENEKGKKVPRQITIIKRDSISAIHSEKIEHRGLYIFGLAYKDNLKSLSAKQQKDYEKKKAQAIDKHEAFVKTNSEFVEGLDSPVVNAFREFMKTWDPGKEADNPQLLSIGKDIESANFIFCLSGYPEILLHNDKSVLNKWNKLFSESKTTDSAVNVRQCAIIGEKLEIARLHNKLKGIPGGQASGTVLICYKNDSESSYGNEQSFNSNVSELAMERYTEALNYLLASKHNRQYVDDTTVIYWAQDGNSQADDLMSMLTFDNEADVKIDDEMLSSLVSDCKNGVVTKEKLTKFETLDLNTDYYFVGIKPNASRLSVKFIYKKEFGDFLLNAAQHQADLKITGLEKVVPIWRLKNELISPKSSNETVNPALVAKVFESILNGGLYPDELLQKAIQRIKTDTDTQINPIRAGIIKACINRKCRFNKKEEEISMSLDKENTNQAYLCGRLFAVLEQIQQKASNYSLNRTIKDAYFSSAVARPASVFPKIIKLSSYHLTKLGNPKYFCDDISEITDKLGGAFPVALTITEQGKFILGYYHQINFKKIKNTEDK